MRKRLLLALLIFSGCAPPPRPPEPPTRPSPASLALLDTLEIPLGPKQSSVWSAALGLAWKQAEAELFHGPIVLGDAPKLRDQVCSIGLTPGDLPTDWVTLKTERSSKGIGIQCSLQAKMPFAIPFFQNDQALEFHDAAGNSHLVASFGIRAKDEYAYYKLREQVEVLFRTEGEGRGPVPALDEYGLDLCKTSEPWRLVVAAIHRPESLAGGIARAQKLAKECPHQPDYQYSIGPNDQLLVPQQHLECSSHATHSVKNAGGSVPMEITQTIRWDLDRGGAELKTEAKVEVLPIPSLYYFDKPYLIYVETREKHQPIFAMWVDNGDCLQSFER